MVSQRGDDTRSDVVDGHSNAVDNGVKVVIEAAEGDSEADKDATASSGASKIDTTAEKLPHVKAAEAALVKGNGQAMWKVCYTQHIRGVCLCRTPWCQSLEPVMSCVSASD